MGIRLVSRFLNSVYDTHPDDDTSKEVYLQAAGLTYSGTGDRHVIIWWPNATMTENGTAVSQVIQLTGQAGNYSYYAPVALEHSPETIGTNQQLFLGNFTRAERDEILQIAKNTQYKKSSTTNGCRVWTRDLLEAVVEAGLISQSLFDEVDTKVPLVKRRPEV